MYLASCRKTPQLADLFLILGYALPVHLFTSWSVLEFGLGWGHASFTLVPQSPRQSGTLTLEMRNLAKGPCVLADGCPTLYTNRWGRDISLWTFWSWKSCFCDVCPLFACSKLGMTSVRRRWRAGVNFGALRRTQTSSTSLSKIREE